MKADDLNRALNYVDERYLSELDTPEQESIPMKNKKKVIRILAVAAMIALLSVTAYAADVLHIRSLESGKSTVYSSFASMDQAMNQLGLQVDCREEFSSGFRFVDASVDEVVGRDEQGKKAMTFQELSAEYRNDAGVRLMINAYADQENIPEDDHLPTKQWNVDGISVSYYLDHYKLVPADYQPSPEEEAWQEQPGNYITYGSDRVEQRDVAFLSWVKDGVAYFIMDSGANVPMETLASMASELMEG